MVQNVVLVFLRRRLSQRPNVEELESRNILKRKFSKYPQNVSSSCNTYHFSFLFSNRFVHFKARTVKKKKKKKRGQWCIGESRGQ